MYKLALNSWHEVWLENNSVCQSISLLKLPSIKLLLCSNIECSYKLSWICSGETLIIESKYESRSISLITYTIYLSFEVYVNCHEFSFSLNYKDFQFHLSWLNHHSVDFLGFPFSNLHYSCSIDIWSETTEGQETGRHWLAKRSAVCLCQLEL